MNKIINLEKNKLLKEKISLLINDFEYDYVICNGLKLLNDINVNFQDKITICYKMAFSYKKNNNLEEAVSVINTGLDYCDKIKDKMDKDYYYRMLWLKHNCMKELGIANLENALNDFIDIKKYYECIGEKRGANMIGFTYGYWKKDPDIMFHHFKKMVKSQPIRTNVKKNHKSNVAFEDALLEIKEINIEYYEIAKEYLSSYMRKCI